MYSFVATHTYGGQIPTGPSKYLSSLPGKFSLGSIKIRTSIGTESRVLPIGGVKTGVILGGQIRPSSMVGSIKNKNNVGGIR